MRYRSLYLVAPLATALLAAITPGAIRAQGVVRAQVTVTLTAVVPPVVKYIVDESIRTADGAPLVRVVTNDPMIRRHQAVAARSELALAEPATEASSGHAKGGEQVSTTESGARLIRYTIVTP